MWARYITSVRHTLVCCLNAPECVLRLSHHLVAPSFIYETFYYNCLMRTLYRDEVSKQVQFSVNITTMILMEHSSRLALRCGFLSVHACSRRLWESRCYRNFVCLVGWWLPTGIAQRSTVDVFSSVCLFVSVFVCLHDNFQTTKLRMMKLGGWVHCTKVSPDFECQHQRSRSLGTKNEKLLSHPGPVRAPGP